MIIGKVPTTPRSLGVQLIILLGTDPRRIRLPLTRAGFSSFLLIPRDHERTMNIEDIGQELGTTRGINPDNTWNQDRDDEGVARELLQGL
jgi:hypothetical protein